jgi:hypothetical protein
VAITIHQAICGESNKSWDLLRTTLVDNSLAKKIAFKADLQDSPPSGVSLQPTVRGFSYDENYYLIIKTYPDTSEDVRNGRVFSHCLIINKSDLPKIYNLQGLFNIFSPTLDKDIQIQLIKYSDGKKDTLLLEANLQQRFNVAIKAFVNNTENFIWIGPENYDFAIAKFWQILSDTQKENLNFGVYFNPSELPQNRINFVVIPDSLQSKFLNTNYEIIKKTDASELTEFSEQFIAGEVNATERLQKFADAIELKNYTHKDISILSKGVPTFENIENITDLKLLNTLAHIIAKFSADDKKGLNVKQTVIDQIRKVLERGTEEDIILIKNFPIKAFKNSTRILESSLKSWVQDFIFASSNEKSIKVSTLFEQVFRNDLKNWWVEFLKEQIQIFCQSLTILKVNLIWKWLKEDISFINNLSIDFDNKYGTELLFINTVPDQINDMDLTILKQFALKQNWLSFYAILLKNQNMPHAITELLKIDKAPNHYDAIKLLLRDMQPEEIIKIALGNTDIRLIKIAGGLCHSTPNLLNDINVTNRNWRLIWISAISTGNQFSDGIKDMTVVYKLFDLVVAGQNIEEFLIQKIGESKYANVLSYKHRALLWKRLSPNTRRQYLVATSAAFLEQLSVDSSTVVPTDRELSDFIITDAITTFLYYNAQNIKAVMPIFLTYSRLPEHVIKGYISNYRGKLDIVDATQLGKLINSRRMTSVASVVNSKMSSNKNYKFALAECYNLLGLLSWGLALLQGKLSNVQVSKDQWWEAFAELTIKLYSSGPLQNKIWTQAQGKEYDLLTNGTGKEIWLAALIKLRNKGCKDITTAKLLKAMLKEHKKNEQLKTIKNLWDKI